MRESLMMVLKIELVWIEERPEHAKVLCVLPRSSVNKEIPYFFLLTNQVLLILLLCVNLCFAFK